MNLKKKAVVIGGSNGIGLALVQGLINKGYHVDILDICEPSYGELERNSNCTYSFFDMTNIDQKLLNMLCADKKINVLFITAGIGRVAEFEYLHEGEINKICTVNLLSTIKIIHAFFSRIKSESDFYCGVMGSIAGIVSSPTFSVYAASKAGICRFVESVNIELEMAGVANRILNVSPGSINGTRFNGGKNNLNETITLAEDILTNLYKRTELYIPQYEETYKAVVERYQRDAHEYGVHSYQYKVNSGRVKNELKGKVGYLSGTFDLFHIGHLNLLRRAKQRCDYLIVGVHPNAAHKGKETFISFEDRKAIVESCKYVDKVVDSCKEDNEAWDKWHYNYLFVGSDYKDTERFNRYEQYFADKEVEIVYLPYTDSTSSTQIRETILQKNNK